ncbi:acyl-CoA thioesterase-1 [Marinobacter zhejiangensis]|uniref:Acyl-CoA thioesterase-1 n=2 Tax=Marinobacter zhejiangensis TaxID=488535 RepID=A0A1I4NZL7_9GAMM|nr:arylesterase [Marinobacter zhejiangensis]SFM20972.1 acyl-CoA thioesterase-1 [Marinobacter zhejiangensis]
MIVLVFVTLVSGLSQASQSTVLVLGDSLSAAYGVQTEQAWVALLKQRLNHQGLGQWQVVNASISGETTDGGLRRLPALLSQHTPDIVVIELGGNDGLRGFPPQVIEENLDQLISLSVAAGAQPLLIGIQIPPNYGPRYTTQFANIYPNLADRHNIALVPFFLQGIYDQEGMMQGDGIHPTTAAQGQLLDNVWPQLEVLLAQ